MKTFCSYFNQSICQSCDLITMDYSDQISLKEEKLRKALSTFTLPVFEKTVRSPEINFRNKAKFSVTGSLENPVIGLTGNDSLDMGRELLDCSLHVLEINQLLPALKSFIQSAGLIPYSIQNKTGELKGIIIFHSSSSKESYLRFILRSKESLDRIKKHLKVLTDKFPELTSISANIQPVPHAILEGEEEIYFTKDHSIQHKLGKVTFSLDPQAFVQTNQFIAEKLYKTAAQWVSESNLKKFMELFCGQGAFSFFCADEIDSGLGIELNPEAVKVANYTARNNRLSHLHFKCADAGNTQSDIELYSPEILLVNPPRRGLAEACDLVLKSGAKRILYSSCNHESLVTDLIKLTETYHINRIQIFDMFPHTSHFETLMEFKIKDD